MEGLLSTGPTPSSLKVILRTSKNSKNLIKTQKFQNVDLLEEGDLGSAGDELEGETPSIHRGTQVPPSDLRQLGHCTQCTQRTQFTV